MAKTAHHVRWGDDGKAVRLCDGRRQELPLPHWKDRDLAPCAACAAAQDTLPPGTPHGVGVSMTMQKE